MEQQVEVEIVVGTISARYGSLPVGATLRTDQAYADHLVYDCEAAKFPKPRSSEDAVQTSAQRDPYTHLGTLVAVVPGAADENTPRE